MPKYKKRKDGRYLAQVQIGFQDNGNPKYKNIYGRTQLELDKKVRDFKAGLDKGIIVDDNNLTFKEWSEKWLELYKRGREYNTVRMYSDALKCHIIPHLGHYKLKDIKKHHVQELINLTANKGLTRTLEIIKITISQILKQAVQSDFIYKNVADGVSIPSMEKSKKRALTDKELEYIENAILELKQRAFVYVLLYTGLRRGEALALTKNDIDLSKNELTVNKSAVMKGNASEIKMPKSESGIRKIPIPMLLADILRNYIPTVKSIYLFPAPKSETLMSRTSFRRFWNGIINQLNIAAGGVDSKDKGKRMQIRVISQDITPHLFRHTYATTLYNAGVDIKTAQYLLGHSSIQMTMDIYTHLSNEDNKNVEDKINMFLNSKNRDQKIANSD